MRECKGQHQGDSNSCY